MIFGSDNQAGASEQVLAELTNAYRTTATAYGSDDYCAAATAALKDLFDTDLEAYFVVSGTAANTLALSAMVKPWDGIICHHQAHVLLDESSGPALLTGGASVISVPDKTVKIIPAQVKNMLVLLPNDRPHNIRPAVLSVSQANECGQVYSPDEIARLSATAKDAGLSVHMDGARFANAIAALDCHPADITWKAGVDALCLGATKNGAVAAEAIIFFDKQLATDFDYRVKRSGHLVSKGRLFGAQFLAWLRDDHWLELARAANTASNTLRDGIASTDGIRLAFPSQSNESFVIMPRPLFDNLLAAGASMYNWYVNSLPEDVTLADNEVLVRLVTSFTTEIAEIEKFLGVCQSHNRNAIA